MRPAAGYTGCVPAYPTAGDAELDPVCIGMTDYPAMANNPPCLENKNAKEPATLALLPWVPWLFNQIRACYGLI
jgi:hypothetical protein